MKKFLSAFALTALLFGCSDEGVKDTEVATKVEEQKTPQQYLAEFQDSPAFQQATENVEVYFTEVTDFEGDSVPEMVLGVGTESVTQAKVMIFTRQNGQWETATSFTFDSHMMTYLAPAGNLSYDDSAKQAFAFENIEAYANSLATTVTILHYNNDSNEIEQLVNLPLESSDTLNWNVAENKFSVTRLDSTFDYIFKNGELVDPDGKRIGVVIDEKLAELVGTTINEHLITTKDSYYSAKDKISEPLITEEYYEGGLCSFYSTFFICNSNPQEGDLVGAYYITPTNEVTVDDLAIFFNQYIEIKEWGNPHMANTYYISEISTDDAMYSLEFNNDSDQAVLQTLTYIPYE